MRDTVSSVLGPQRVATVDTSALEAALSRLWAAAQRAWPTVQVASTDWARAVADRVPSEGALLPALAKLETGDLLLALGCAQGQRPALVAFETVLQSLRPALERAGAESALVDDLLAQLRARLLVAPETGTPKILQYGARARLSGWLRVAVMRDFGAHAKRRRHDDDAELEALLVSGGDPELDELRHRFRAEFRAAFGEALRGLKDKERGVLRLHLIDRLSIDRIGALHGVHRSTAARWLVDIRGQLYARTQDEFRARLGLAPDEFESLMAMVLSQLTYSVGGDL